MTAPGKPRTWVLWVLATPAAVAVWSGWVGLGRLVGFGRVHPLPGIVDSLVIDSAITLPVGVEAYGAYALRCWLAGRPGAASTRFARASALASLIVGALGQVAYHTLTAAGVTRAPWWLVALVSILPVAVLGMGAALAHLVTHDATEPAPVPVEPVVEVLDHEELVQPADQAPVPVLIAAPEVAPEPEPEPTPEQPMPESEPVAVPVAVRVARRAATPSAEEVQALAAAEPGLTQADLAERLGTSVRTVQRRLKEPTASDAAEGVAA